MRTPELELACKALYRFLLGSATIRQAYPTYLCKRSTAARYYCKTAAYWNLQTSRPSRAQQPSFLQGKIYDENITSPFINLVDENGKFHPSVHRNDVLSSMDRSSYHLIQVKPGNPDEQLPPTCKITPIASLFTAAKEQQRKATGIDSSKQVELHWTIDAGDLSHKLGQIVEFLEDGRRVEILIKPKKRSRKATEAEAAAVFRKVQDTAASVQGAQRVKAMEGQVGAMVTFSYESPDKQAERRHLERKESSEKALEKRKKLEDKDFEKKVLEKQKKFEMKRLEKARRELEPRVVIRRTRVSDERSRFPSAWSRY